ncbi:MAG TPA: PadR family transcriptional regulator [Candidatus Binatia bacterium]|jgi:DNA-binding PadR family transcriptional regulator
MSIKYAVLGLLAEQPMHGYRLKDAFDERVGGLWGLTTGQIYQTLKQLERDGSLEARGERVGNRPARRIYSVTAQGTRALQAWLDETPAPWSRPFRAELLIRLLFLRPGDLSRVGRALDREEQDALHLKARIGHMTRDGRPPGGVDVLGLFLDGITHHLDADVTMLRRVREAVIAWGRAEGADVAPLVASAAAAQGPSAAVAPPPAAGPAAAPASAPAAADASPAASSAVASSGPRKATVRRLPVKRIVRKRRTRPAPRRQAPPSRRVAGR